MSGSKGPNSGATAFGQAYAFARAFACVSPNVFNAWFPLLEVQQNDRSADVPNVWHRAIFPNGDTWAWMVENGGGRSQREPPLGAPLGGLFTVEASNVKFLQFVARAEKLQQEGHAPPGKPLSESSRQLLSNAVRCGDPGWPAQLTHDLVGPMRQAAHNGAAPADILGQMKGAMEQVMALRSQFGVDIRTAVGLIGSMRLTGKALNAQLTPEQALRVVGSLLGSEQNDPWELLSDVASAVLDVGLVDVVLDCANEDREAGVRGINRALASETVEEHFNHLYGALTRTWFALALHRLLAQWGPGDARGRHRRVATELDERSVRISLPLIRQLIDLNTDVVWARHLAQVRAAPTDDAAVAMVRKLTGDSLFYPTQVGHRLILARLHLDLQ